MTYEEIELAVSYVWGPLVERVLDRETRPTYDLGTVDRCRSIFPGIDTAVFYRKDQLLQRVSPEYLETLLAIMAETEMADI